MRHSSRERLLQYGYPLLVHYPEHGETILSKSLVLINPGRASMVNMICWMLAFKPFTTPSDYPSRPDGPTRCAGHLTAVFG